MNSTENTVCVPTGSTQQENDEKPESDTTKISGIYKIINKVNGKYYVGSSLDIYHRFKEHKQYLMHNYHFNDHLQHAWNKYGNEKFEFVIIEQYSCIGRKELLNIEQKYLTTIQATPSIAYNLRYNAEGGQMSEYSKKKIGDKNRGRKHSLESKLKMKLAAQTKAPMADTTKQKISLSKMGHKNPNYHKIPSDETRIKQSIATSGQNNSRFISTIYTFKNKYTDGMFTGTCYDFRMAHNISSGRLASIMRGALSHVKGWYLLSKTSQFTLLTTS
jgi:group I intron endonuclease